MPLDAANRKIFRTAEAAKKLGVSRSTLLRWFHENRVDDVRRDYRGWREFSNREIRRIKRQIEGKNT